MVDIKAKVVGHALTLVQSPQAAAGSVRADRVQFTFDEAWDGLSKRALFWGAGSDEPYAAVVDASGYAVIPWEVLQERSKIKFGVYGTEPGQTTPRITSTLAKYSVQEGAWSESIANAGTPTPTLIEQFEAAAAAAMADMEDAEARVDEKLAQLAIDAALVYPKQVGTGAVVSVAGTVAAPVQGLTIYGRSVQDGTPSPSSPAEITTAGSSGTLNIWSAGKNLIRYVNAIKNVGDSMTTDLGLTVTHLADGGLSFVGTVSSSGNVVISGLNNSNPLMLPDGRYTLSQESENLPSGSSVFMWLKSGQTKLAPATFDFANADVSGNANIGVTFTAGQAVNCTIRPMLRLASVTDATYVPYIGTSAALPTPNGLPGIPVSSGGNHTDASGQQWICDTIDLEAGTYTRRCGSVTWDGSSDENWTAQSGWSLPGFTIRVTDSYVQTNTSIAPTVLCNRLVPIPNNSSYSEYDSLLSMSNSAPDYHVAIRGYSGDTAFRAYLSSAPITMLYPLAAPVVSALTAAQKAALAAVRSQKGHTVLFAADAAAPELRAEVVIDIPTYLQGLMGN